MQIMYHSMPFRKVSYSRFKAWIRFLIGRVVAMR